MSSTDHTIHMHAHIDGFDILKRHNEGKTIRELEIGIEYPDGTAEWKKPDAWASQTGYDFEIEESRDGYESEWADGFKKLNTAVPKKGLRFMQRIAKTSFGTPETLK